MADEDNETPVANAEILSVETALANSVRLLRMAEFETDRQLMERLERLADSWANVAALLMRD